MINLRKRKFAHRTVCGVEMAARPNKTSLYVETFSTSKITLVLSFTTGNDGSIAALYCKTQSLHQPNFLKKICFYLADPDTFFVRLTVLKLENKFILKSSNSLPLIFESAYEQTPDANFENRGDKKDSRFFFGYQRHFAFARTLSSDKSNQI